MPRVMLTFDPGTKFGHWTVLGTGKLIRGRYTSSLCQCSCGITRFVRNTSLKTNRAKSCGHIGRFERGNASRRKLPEGIAARNSALYHMKHSAKIRGLVFQLSDQFVFSLMKKPCYWCGESNVNIASQKDYNGSFRYNGIDRLDSAKGYVRGNVVPCCGPCNRIKNRFTREGFIAYCVMVAVRHGGCRPVERQV